MIRIDRNPRRALAEAQKQALLVLQKGELELAELEKLAAAGSLENKSFKREIYAADEVRDYLWQLQKYKCCFCERKFECKYSTIEHFRPKTKAERATGSFVGYWWLAYELKNLYFCCQICNNLKGNYFPLALGSQELSPPGKPWESQNQEKALLLDPGFDDPEEHLTFQWLPNQKKIYPVAVNGSLRGKATAARILDRDDLQKLLYEHYQRFLVPVIKRYKRALQNGDPVEAGFALSEARQLVASGCEYSLLAKVSFKRAGLKLF